MAKREPQCSDCGSPLIHSRHEVLCTRCGLVIDDAPCDFIGGGFDSNGVPKHLPAVTPLEPEVGSYFGTRLNGIKKPKVTSFV